MANDSPPTFLVDDSVVTTRSLEVPDADFSNGMNVGGSCAPGIGINMLQGAVVGEPQQFTLLDQKGDARAPQTSQFIGGEPYCDPANWPSSGGQSGFLPEDSLRYGDPSDSGDGSITPTANCALNDIAVGWVAGV